MKFALRATAALLLTTAAAQAGGIERYNQGLEPLFEDGNYLQLGFGVVKPSVDGADVPQFVGSTPVYAGGVSTGGVAGNYNQVGIAYKHQFNDSLSGLLMLNEPFGADIRYPTVAEGGTPLLGGTAAEVNSKHLTGVLRYKMPNNFAVHGGVNISRANAEVTLSGMAYSDPTTGRSVSGYNVKLGDDTAVGWLAGVSWEKPEIAARVALTYHSAIDHEFDSTEILTTTLAGAAALAKGLPVGSVPANAPLPTGVTKVTTPKSLTLDFQTGVAADTLVFGSIRWVEWSSFKVAPPVYGAALGSLTELEDTTTYTLGVGRRFTEQWSGSASVSFEKKGDDLVSPLAPTNGKIALTLAGIYTKDNMKITTGINYTKVGDAKPETGTPDTARALMDNNHALAMGVRFGFTF